MTRLYQVRAAQARGGSPGPDPHRAGFLPLPAFNAMAPAAARTRILTFRDGPGDW